MEKYDIFIELYSVQKLQNNQVEERASNFNVILESLLIERG